MKILRSSMYPPTPGCHPITVVVPEHALHSSAEEVAEIMAHPGMFVINDIFEAEECNEIHATFLGLNRLKDSARQAEECNMAISYYWNAAQLPRITKGGTLANPAPAPLKAEHLKVILKQLAKHPDYDGQRIIMFSRNEEAVMLRPEGDIDVIKVR